MKKALSAIFTLMVLAFTANAQVNSTETDTIGEEEILLTTDEDYFFFDPQYDMIQQYCSDKKSSYYYPTLLKRFLKGDTTMSLDDVHFLYYGSVYQKWYSPYSHSELEDKALEILNKEDVGKKDAKKAYKLLTKAISEYPTDLDLYIYRYVASMTCFGEDSKECQQDVFRFTMLLYTIANSGNGESQAHAYHVIDPSHSYNLMSIMGLSPTQQSLSFGDNGDAYDIFDLDSNDEGIETIYFNVTRPFSSLSSMFDGIEFEDSEDEGNLEEPSVE